MRFTGTAAFAASRERVWTFLLDPANLGPCSPVPITPVDGSHYRIQTRVGSGFLSTTLVVNLDVVQIVEGRSARIDGKGGASGIAIESAVTFDLRDGAAEKTTDVDWQVDVTLSGAFAGAAGRIIEERASEAVERLIACVRIEIQG